MTDATWLLLQEDQFWDKTSLGPGRIMIKAISLFNCGPCLRLDSTTKLKQQKYYIHSHQHLRTCNYWGENHRYHIKKNKNYAFKMCLLLIHCICYEHTLFHLMPQQHLYRHHEAISYTIEDQFIYLGTGTIRRCKLPRLMLQWNSIIMRILEETTIMMRRTNLWSINSSCPSTRLDPPTDLSTKIENSSLSSLMYIPRLIWKLSK